jgi:O-antigen ligase
MSSKENRLPDAPTLATLGVCIYLVGFASPVPSQLPLLLFVGFAVLSALRGGPNIAPVPRMLSGSVVLFLLATGASMLFSFDRPRSLALSAAWIPGVLLFVVISERLRSANWIRVLYACLTFVALALASTLLGAAALYGRNPHEWIADLGMPVLVVPNDANFLALLCPLALVLLLDRPRSAQGVLAGAAIFAVALLIAVFSSRGAALTLAVSLVLAGGLLRPRLGATLGVALAVGFVVIDGLQGFALASKFTRVVDTRISLWLLAWEMFLDAPWLGHGPNTYKTLYPTYLQLMQFPDWVKLDPWGGAVPWAHNLYLELLAERGLLGLATFVGMLGTGLAIAIRTLREGTGDVRLLVAGALASLCGFLFSGLYETSLIRVWAVVLLCTLLGAIGSLAGLQSGNETKNDTPAHRSQGSQSTKLD